VRIVISFYYLYTQMDTSKTKQLHVLAQLALADEDFNDDEKAAIREIGARYKVPKKEVEWIVQNPDTSASLDPMEIPDKMDYLIDCMHVLLIDHEIHENEDKFIRTLAADLGFKDKVITFLEDYHTMERGPLKDMMIKYLL
jgi:uncharacterized tellurite resistance protein B-like protein